MPITDMQELYSIAVSTYYNRFREDLCEFYNGNWPIREVVDSWDMINSMRPETMNFIKTHHTKYHNVLLKMDALYRNNTHHTAMYNQFNRSILTHACGQADAYQDLINSGTEDPGLHTLWTPEETREAAMLLIDYIDWRKASFPTQVVYLELPEGSEPVNVADYMRDKPDTVSYVLFHDLQTKRNDAGWSPSFTRNRYTTNTVGYPILGGRDPHLMTTYRERILKLRSSEILS